MMLPEIIITTLANAEQQTQNEYAAMEESHAKLQEVALKTIQALKEERLQLLNEKTILHKGIKEAKEKELNRLSQIKLETLDNIRNKTAKTKEMLKEIEEVNTYIQYLKNSIHGQEAAYVAWSKQFKDI